MERVRKSEKGGLGLFMAVLAIAAVLVVAGSFVLAYREVDILAESRQAQTISHAITEHGIALRRELKMQTVWGEAFKNTTVAPSSAWMGEFYGSYLSNLLGYDEITVLDAQDRTIFGFADGTIDGGQSFERNRPVLADLVALLRQPEPGIQVAVSRVALGDGRYLEHRAVSDIRVIDGRPSNVVVQTIVPDADPGHDVTLPEKPALLVATFRLDDAFLSELGSRTGYRDLRWFAKGEPLAGHSFAVLQDSRGDVAGTLSWTADLPSELLLKRMTNGFLFALLLLAGLGATGVAAVRRQTRAMAEGRQREARLARTDFLTGLPNRLALSETVPAMLEASAGDALVGIVSIDLDGFKDINDSLGHQAGDSALVAVAERLSGAFTDGFVTRTGGDEFVMAVICKDPSGVAAAAEKAVRILSTPFVLPDGLNAGLGASVGYAVAPSDGQHIHDLLRRSDLALFKAKRGGKGRAVAFDAGMEAAVVRRRTLEAALRRAVTKDQIGVAYQPIYADDGSTVLGVEALARWDDPNLGIVHPSEFIPIAEETGLIVRLGEQVLRKAVRYAAGFDRLSVAVNVSAQQIHNADVVATVAAVLAETGLPPARLEIELTESILIADEERADEQIKGLQALGVKVALDDFGTGYSSLLYLRRFGFDKLKIDRQFVQDSEKADEARTLVSQIIAMSRALGLDVTAEGVENETQHAFLRDAGCDRLQGYLFSRPITGPALARMMADAEGSHAAA
jgi:diguanylate cyclase (GGDEF)-like protein